MEMKPPDDHIRRHCLGLLSGTEQDQVESFLMSDPHASDVFEIAEQELAEAFVRGELSAEEARAFEATLLPRPEVRARVELIRYLVEAGRKKGGSGSPRSQGFALAAVLLVGIALAGRALMTPAPPAVPPNAQLTQTLRLTEGVVRSGVTPASSGLVAGRDAILEIPLHEGDRFSRYRVTLRQGTRQVMEAHSPRPASLVLRVEVASALLTPGELKVTVEGESSAEWLVIETFVVSVSSPVAPPPL